MAYVPQASPSLSLAASVELSCQANESMDYLDTLRKLGPLQDYCAAVESECSQADTPPIVKGSYPIQGMGPAPWSDFTNGCQTTTDDIFASSSSPASEFAASPRCLGSSTPQLGSATMEFRDAGQRMEYAYRTLQHSPCADTNDAEFLLHSEGKSELKQFVCPLETQLPKQRTVLAKRKRPNADLYSQVLRQTVDTKCIHYKYQEEADSQDNSRDEDECLRPSLRRENNPGPNVKIYRHAKKARFALRAKQAFVAQQAQRQTKDGGDRKLPSVIAATRAMERREREYEGADEEMESTRGDVVRLAKWAGWANYALEADEACLTLAK